MTDTWYVIDFSRLYNGAVVRRSGGAGNCGVVIVGGILLTASFYHSRVVRVSYVARFMRPRVDAGRAEAAVSRRAIVISR